MVLLRGAELTDFANIVQQLLILHPELLGCSAKARQFPLIIRAYRKFVSMGPNADWLKMLLTNHLVAQFKTSNLKVPFTIARAIALEYGQTSWAQAEGIVQSAAIQELVAEALSILRVEQGEKTVDTQPIREWLEKSFRLFKGRGPQESAKTDQR